MSQSDEGGRLAKAPVFRVCFLHAGDRANRPVSRRFGVSNAAGSDSRVLVNGPIGNRGWQET